MRVNWCHTLAAFGAAGIASLVLPAGAAEFKETIWTAPLDTFHTKCAVTNASNSDLRVVIRILDALGRTANPDTPVPLIVQLTTGEVVRDGEGFPLTELDVILPPGGSDGIFRDRAPADSITPPTSCHVRAEQVGVTRVSYCEILSDETEVTNCMQAP